jgi:hypothetical protein
MSQRMSTAPKLSTSLKLSPEWAEFFGDLLRMREAKRVAEQARHEADQKRAGNVNIIHTVDVKG